MASDPAGWLEARYDQCVALRREREDIDRRQARTTDDPDKARELAREHRQITDQLNDMGDQT